MHNIEIENGSVIITDSLNIYNINVEGKKCFSNLKHIKTIWNRNIENNTFSIKTENNPLVNIYHSFDNAEMVCIFYVESKCNIIFNTNEYIILHGPIDFETVKTYCNNNGKCGNIIIEAEKNWFNNK